MATTKSRLALRANVQNYGRYFWTFTLPFEASPLETCALWDALRRRLVKSLGFSGIRVYEFHPGGHGLHVHVVTWGYYDVRLVRVISDAVGWGRIHVVKIRGRNRSRICDYLAKYVCKFMRTKSSLYVKGMRIWGVFGKIPVSSRYRISDIVCKSVFCEFFSWLRRCHHELIDYCKRRSASERGANYSFLCIASRAWNLLCPRWGWLRDEFEGVFCDC